MNRRELQRLSAIRRRDAKVLLDGARFEGAYYLIGYSVECALKACIAAKVKRHQFPDKDLANEVYTHSLEKLVRLAGLQLALDKAIKVRLSLRLNWAVAKDWKENARYRPRVTERDARGLYKACTARKGGVLNWIRKQW